MSINGHICSISLELTLKTGTSLLLIRLLSRSGEGDREGGKRENGGGEMEDEGGDIEGGD